MYVVGIWKNAGLGNQGSMGNNEDTIYDYISASNLGGIGLGRSIIHSIPGVDCYRDYINAG